VRGSGKKGPPPDDWTPIQKRTRRKERRKKEGEDSGISRKKATFLFYPVGFGIEPAGKREVTKRGKNYESHPDDGTRSSHFEKRGENRWKGNC